MSHQIMWSVPHRVLHSVQTGTIPAEESQAIAHEIHSTIDADSGSTIHVLVDVRGATMRDKLWNYTKLDLKRHPRCGMIVLIGDSRVTGLLISILSNVLNISMHYNATPESAMKFLQERDTMVAEYFASAVTDSEI